MAVMNIGFNLLNTTTISDDASVEFTSDYITSSYQHYIVEFSNVVPETDDVRLYMQMGTANTADTGLKYRWITQTTGVQNLDSDDWYWCSSGTALNTVMQITSCFINELGTGTGENFNGQLKVYNVNSTSAYKTVGNMDSFPSYGEQGHSSATQFLSGTYENQTAVNYLKFYLSSGNLESGQVRLYGVR